ncbi:dihydrofolate reductase family protein [Mucilaginibacter sp. HD30]
MGKVIVLISVTPDGFADAENVIVDPDFFDFTLALMSESDIAAFGRHTFEMFQDRWPKRLVDEETPDWVRKMAQALHDIAKVVFSSTLTNTTWHNSTISNQLYADYIRTFKQENSGALITFGSLSLVEELTRMNLVDDYYFNILPLLSGKGEARFFNRLNLEMPQALKYIESKTLASGSHVIHYQNATVNT